MKNIMQRMTLIAILMCAFPIIAFSQEQQTPQSANRPPVVIMFMVPINSDTVNMLLRTVNQQSQSGVKDITLVLASPGGDTAAGFAAYNVLKSLAGINLPTFNVGNIDSAAMLIYCAGAHRYSLPGPAVRFLIHGNALTLPPGIPMDASFLDAQDAQIKSLNQMVIEAISTVALRIEPFFRQSKRKKILQEIRGSFMTPGSTLLSVNTPSAPEQQPIEYKSAEQSIGSKTITQ